MRHVHLFSHSSLAGQVAIMSLGAFFVIDCQNSVIQSVQSDKLASTRKTCADGSVVERVTFNSRLGEDPSQTLVREGILYSNPHAKATILISHGFMCSKDDINILRPLLFPRSDFNVMTFDFRAHGKRTEGQHCTFGADEAHDVIAAAQFLRSRSDLKDKPLFAYGFSMGAVASLGAQSLDSKLFNAMILDCPFDSSETVVKKGLANAKVSILGYEFNIPGKWILERYVYDPYVQSFIRGTLKTFSRQHHRDIPIHIRPFSPLEWAKSVSVPCLFIHCKNDEKIPLESAKMLFNSVQGYKELWITNGRHHYDSLIHDPEEYVFRVRNFIDRFLSGALHQEAEGLIIEDPDDSNELAQMAQR